MSSSLSNFSYSQRSSELQFIAHGLVRMFLADADQAAHGAGFVAEGAVVPEHPTPDAELRDDGAVARFGKALVGGRCNDLSEIVLALAWD